MVYVDSFCSSPKLRCFLVTDAENAIARSPHSFRRSEPALFIRERGLFRVISEPFVIIARTMIIRSPFPVLRLNVSHLPVLIFE